MIKYSVVPYSSELDDGVAFLFRKEGFRRSKEFLRWIFSPPAGVGLIAIGLDTEANNRLAGVLGLLPTRVVASGEVQKSYLIIDVMVDPEFRGRGVFTGLAKAAMSAAEQVGAAFVWGFPNDQAAHGWFQRFGWRRLGSPPLMVRPLRTGIFTRKLGPALRRMDFPIVATPRLGFEAKTIRRFGPEADELWTELSKRVGCAVWRDSEWLNWRTVDAPERDYRITGAFAEGKLTAFVVTSRQERRGLRLLYVMEALSSDPDQRLLARLIRHESAIAARDGCAAALCLSPPGGPNRNAFRKAGFWSLPTRFHPSETHFGIGPLRSVAEAALALESWYISYLDSDAI